MKKHYLILTITLFCIFGVSKNIYATEYFDTYYGSISWEEERLRLDSLATYLTVHSDSISYIAFFVGEKDKLKNVEIRMKRAKKYLVNKRKISESRIIIVNAGKDDITRIILQPQKKNAPPMTF